MSRTKKEYSTNSLNNYNRFLKNSKLTKKDITYKKYCQNLEVCNWMFIEYALSTGNKVSLPYGFGTIAINKKKLKRYKEYKGKRYVNLRVNWAKTKKAGKLVYHTNEHSDGYNFKWLWFSRDARIYLSDLYVFKPWRYVSRAINEYVRDPNTQYKDMYMEWKK